MISVGPGDLVVITEPNHGFLFGVFLRAPDLIHGTVRLLAQALENENCVWHSIEAEEEKFQIPYVLPVARIVSMNGENDYYCEIDRTAVARFCEFTSQKTWSWLTLKNAESFIDEAILCMDKQDKALALMLRIIN